MSDKTPCRRWFQYSLRSLLLLLLGVGLWLGYEVNWASRQQRHAVAIEEAGGSVEYERYRWSLLRFYDSKTYGRMVVKARIPGTRVADAEPHLVGVSHLRQLTIVYDGTCDLYPHLDDVRAALPDVAVAPVGTTLLRSSSDADLKKTKRLVDRWAAIEKRLRRSVRRNTLVAPRLADSKRSQSLLDYKQALRSGQETRSDFEYFLYDPHGGWGGWEGWIEVHLVPMEDGATAEIIQVGTSYFHRAWGSPPHITTTLLVRDRIVDKHPLTHIDRDWSDAHLDDVNSDGWIDLVSSCGRRRGQKWEEYHQVHRIDSQGFHLMECLTDKQLQRAVRRLETD